MSAHSPPTTIETPPSSLFLRTATLADAAGMHALVRASTLDDNSAYAYLLLCSHFSDTCVVAEYGQYEHHVPASECAGKSSGDPLGGASCFYQDRSALESQATKELAGFVAAYKLPTRPDVVFVWQIGVASTARRRGLGLRLLQHLLALPSCDDVSFLEATVTPSNLASARLFQSFAEARGAACEIGKGFDSHLFGTESHEAEQLYRIGPFGTSFNGNPNATSP